MEKITVKFEDNSAQIKGAIDKAAIKWLESAKAELSAQASKNSPVDTGALKTSFVTDSMVVDSEYTAYIGSSLEYAIWQEYGTGEYAVEGNGRKGGWVYQDPKTGEYRFTRGTKPKRMLYHAFQTKKASLKNLAQQIFKGI